MEGFETGTLDGWAVTDAPTSATHSYFPSSSTALPLADLGTVGPASGTFYAVSDMTGSGTSALSQSFTVPAAADSVVLSFDMFVNDFNQWLNGTPAIVDPIGLDHTGPANQHARVDVLSSAAGSFDTGVEVLAQLYIGTDPGANPSGIPYISYQFDITDAVGSGGTFQLRFAQTDNAIFLNQGIDNVSILYTAAAVLDNCTEVANPTQVDGDRDGFGNACDGDLDQDGAVTILDFAPWLSCFMIGVVPATHGPIEDPACEESDLNGDGFVNGSDFSFFLDQFGGAPGPSDLTCADPTGATAPCFDPQGQGDTDGDSVVNIDDVCKVIRNGPNDSLTQLDSDSDGFGNACDADLNQDGVVDTFDLGTFVSCFLIGVVGPGGPVEDPSCAESDANGDGVVNSADIGLVINQFIQGAPGP